MINDPQPSESAAPGDTEAKRLQPDSGKRSADRIVVGIGDSGADHYRTALGLAARMSRQRAATITLIHGSLPRLAVAASRTEALQRHLARGREVVEEARLTISRMVDPNIGVHAEAVAKTGVDALLQQSGTAAALILQRRNLSTLSRAFNSATSQTVAAQAGCPVIVVRH
jgi:nucleotide-binding universal stress UspA family protein